MPVLKPKYGIPKFEIAVRHGSVLATGRCKRGLKLFGSPVLISKGSLNLK